MSEINLKKNTDTLELNEVLNLLKAEASLDATKEEIDKIEPLYSLEGVKKLLSETEAAYLLCAKYQAPSIGNAPDITSSLSRAEVGAVLSIKELIQVSDILRVIRSVHSWRENCEAENGTAIDYLFTSLYPNKFLEDKINSVIKSEDEIYDKASPALYDIRRNISVKSTKIRDILDKTVRGSMAKYLQDAIITQRDGRFVVPVKIEYRSEIKGIVHDTSSTGQTLFVEPMSVVEQNNDIRVLKNKEREEINRILAELTEACAEFSDSMKVSLESLKKIDLVFSKARLAYKMNASMPKLNGEGRVNLVKARHPLIDAKKVVAIDISLGNSYDTLVITGPNTGGKTVAVKTLGLLTLMTMCGLMIPANDESEIAVFGKIFADIGDEQSIEHDLSTFSSHMVNIISIINNCDGNSLVLLDELCSGTDPVEGAALAKAILINLSSIGAKSVITTHYPELKTYALETENVQNASCEFDIKTLKPTYRLITGMPGRSNAFAISERLGMPKDIIELAGLQVNEEDRRFEKIVADLEKARLSAEEEKKKASMLKSDLDIQKKASDELIEKTYKEREKLLEETRRTAAQIIDNARYKSSLILNELEEIKKTFNNDNADINLRKAKSMYGTGLDRLEENSDVVSTADSGEKLSSPPKENDVVTVSGIGSDATVISVEKNRVLVLAGSAKMWVDFSDLRVKKSAYKSKVPPKRRNVSGLLSREKRTVSGELDIRGFATDEGIMELDKYIDEAVLTGISVITIIHGKGTGTLRKAVQSHLRKHKNVKSFRVGTFGEGENGVTIAELKD